MLVEVEVEVVVVACSLVAALLWSGLFTGPACLGVPVCTWLIS